MTSLRVPLCSLATFPLGMKAFRNERAFTHRWAAHKVSTLAIDNQFGRLSDAAHAQRQYSVAPRLERPPRIVTCFDQRTAETQDRSETSRRDPIGNADTRANKFGANRFMGLIFAAVTLSVIEYVGRILFRQF